MKEKGFTLIEILVAVILIGIISVIVIGKIMGAQDAATTIACVANMDAFASEINLMSLTGPAPTQEQVRDHIKWPDERYRNYWYIPNNSDFNKGHGNDLDGCDEENPGQSSKNRTCIPMRFLIVCTHTTHGNNSDAKYCFHTGGGMPGQIVAYEQFRHTYLQDAKWWPREDPGFDKWIGRTPTK